MSSALVDLDAPYNTPDVQALFASLKGALPELEKLLAETSGAWGYEDPVYRFYHRALQGLCARALDQADRLGITGASARAAAERLVRANRL